MDLTRIMLKNMMSNHKPGDILPKFNVEKAQEYSKWLSYIPDFEKQYITELADKDIFDLSSDQVESIKNFKKRQELIPIFERYLSENCQLEDILPVYDYMKKTDLFDLMKSKLTSDELDEAKAIVLKEKQLPFNDLYAFVKENKKAENYKSLTMVEAFALHLLNRIATDKTCRKLDQEISAQTYLLLKKPNEHNTL